MAGTGNRVRYETCVAIWELVSSGAKGSAVAKAMGVTAQTVSRINMIFSAVRDGKEAELSDSTALFTYYIEYANKYFAPQKSVRSAENDERNDIAEICARLSAISYGITQTNKLLEKMLDLWEGK